MSRSDDPAHCPACATESRKQLSRFAVSLSLLNDSLPLMGGGGCGWGGTCACGA